MDVEVMALVSEEEQEMGCCCQLETWQLVVY
jgi:hypothetical protein